MSTYGAIYLVTNTVTGKVYVGQTKQPISKLWYQHCKDAGRRSYPLHLAIRKYGAAAPAVTEIGRAESQIQLNEMEMQFVREHRADQRGHGYNLRAGGDCGGEFSLETRLKMSHAKKGRPATNKGQRMPEHQRLQMIARFKIKHPCTGRITSEAAKAKIGAANRIHGLGRKQSEETRQKHSAATLKRFSTPESRERLSESLLGHACPPAAREKIRARMLGREIRPEWREKLRMANLGKKQSPGTIEKKSAAVRRFYEARRAAAK